MEPETQYFEQPRPMPHAPCPMPHAPCPMPHAPCPMPQDLDHYPEPSDPDED